MIKILIGLAAQLTDEGDLTPLVNGAQAGSKITVDDFLQSTTAHNVRKIFSREEDRIFANDYCTYRLLLVSIIRKIFSLH